MHGKFPQILTDGVVGTEATKLYNDANALLDKLVAEKWLTAQGVIGFWEASATAADTIEVRGLKSEVRLESLRQQIKKAPGQPNLSLTDFIKPVPTPGSRLLTLDYIGAFSVTIHGIEDHIKKFEAAHDDYNNTLQALADRFAEAFAELLHKK